jgi:ribonuclease HI
MKYILHTDGGARGNPGPAAAGVVLTDLDGNTVTKLGSYLGEITNNEAEYRALILGLQTAINEGTLELDCYLDSELVVKQLNGEYRVKNENLKGFWKQVKDLEFQFQSITYNHVKRNKNKDADSLVNEVLDAAEN